MLTLAPHDIPDALSAHAAWVTVELLEESRAVYEMFPALERFRDFLGLLRWSDVSWQGAQAVIIRSGANFAGKYSRTFDVDGDRELGMEFDRHNTILEIYNHWRDIGEIPESVAIPRLRFGYNQNPGNPYVMEHISGRNLFSIRMAKLLLPPSCMETVARANDFEIREMILKQKGIDIFVHSILTRKLDGMDILRGISPTRADEVQTTLAFLRKNWVRHKDLHEWNIMIWDNGKTYIIDFGIMEMNRKLIEKFREQQTTLH